MKRILTIIMILVLSFNAFAQQTESKEKIVTTKWSFLVGSASFADHYISNQEYNSSASLGFSIEFGSFYKSNENLSWKLDISYLGLGRTPVNPAGTGKLNAACT